MRVAFFTHYFLEPTHFAIGQLLDEVQGTAFSVFARRFSSLPDGLGLRNVARRVLVSSAQHQPSTSLDCDLVHSVYDGDITFDAIEMASRAGLPVLISFHGGFDTNAKIFDQRYRARTLEACRRAAAITVVGPSDRRRLASLGVTEGVEVLPVPVDFRWLPVRANYDEHKLILIARLIPKKGIDVALECLALLPSEFTLTVIGAGEQHGPLIAAAQRLGLGDRITWAGYLPLKEALDMLAEAVVLIHPARVASDGNADGTPQIIIWAQALGVPVVATTSGSMRDVVEDRLTGRVVDPDSPRQLRDAVLELVSDDSLRRQCIQAARRTAERHRVDLVAAQLGALYAGVAGRPRLASAVPPAATGTPGLAALAEAAALVNADVSSCQHVGSGGHGDVLLLRRLEGPLAIKIPGYERHTPDRWPLLEQKLIREWRVLTDARGRGLPAPVHIDPAGRFLIRDFVVGEPLSRAVRYLVPNARAAMCATVLSLGHQLFTRFHTGPLGVFLLRDFKPRNIVVSTEGLLRATLIDVGAVCEAGEALTRVWDRTRLGTRQWLHWAPEELLGIADVIDARVDYFALGVTAYFALTGTWPYSNSTEAHPDDVWRQYRLEFASAVARLETDGLASGLDPRLARFVAECMDPTLSQRRRNYPAEIAQLLRAESPLSASDAFGL